LHSFGALFWCVMFFVVQGSFNKLSDKDNR